MSTQNPGVGLAPGVLWVRDEAAEETKEPPADVDNASGGVGGGGVLWTRQEEPAIQGDEQGSASVLSRGPQLGMKDGDQDSGPRNGSMLPGREVDGHNGYDGHQGSSKSAPRASIVQFLAPGVRGEKKALNGSAGGRMVLLDEVDAVAVFDNVE